MAIFRKPSASRGEVPDNAALLLETYAISKSFGAVRALHDFDFCIRRGETVALVGDNGAGKSTFINILAGVYPPDSGRVFYKGESVAIRSPDHARSLGIETIYQDLALCDNLSVAANIFLGRELRSGAGPFRILNKKAMRKISETALAELIVNMPPINEPVAKLSGGQRQVVALARAELWGQDLLLLDEPTAALGVQESDRVLEVIRQMQAQGFAVVLISHNLPLVLEMSDRVVVLRHGVKVGDVPRQLLCGEDVVALITGSRESWIC